MPVANIILAKCGLEFCVEFVKFTFAAAFHIVFLCNLVNLKKHRLRLWILELTVLRIPRTSPILFRSVQLPKKFGWKFWILILQKSWKKLALKFDKNYAEKYFSQNKIEKINAWKICSWKSSNWKNCCLSLRKTK